MNQRQVREGRLRQGVDERIAYTVTTTPWGSAPTDSAVKLFDVTTGTKVDASTTCLTGTPSVQGDVITTPLVSGLTAGHLYRLEVQFVCSGNTFEAFAEIMAEE